MAIDSHIQALASALGFSGSFDVLCVYHQGSTKYRASLIGSDGVALVTGAEDVSQGAAVNNLKIALRAQINALITASLAQIVLWRAGLAA